MYFVLVILLTIILPIASIAWEMLAQPGTSLLFLVGKWFVFWGVGVRLLVAGLMQVARPSFTASSILGIKAPEADLLVSELGFANIAMGLVGVLTLLRPDWIAPAGLAGGLFLGAAGLRHLFKSDRNGKENLAMVTDLLVAAAMAVYLIWRLMT